MSHTLLIDAKGLYMQKNKSFWDSKIKNLINNGKLLKAFPLIKNTVKNETPDIYDYDDIIDVYVSYGYLDEAIELSNLALYHFPNDSGLLNVIALLFLLKGDLSLSKTMYQCAVQYNPKKPTAYYNLGNFHQTVESYKTAIIYYHNSLELFSSLNDEQKNETELTSADIYNQIGFTYECMKNMRLAFEFYRKAYLEDPTDVIALGNSIEVAEYIMQSNLIPFPIKPKRSNEEHVTLIRYKQICTYKEYQKTIKSIFDQHKTTFDDIVAYEKNKSLENKVLNILHLPTTCHNGTRLMRCALNDDELNEYLYDLDPFPPRYVLRSSEAFKVYLKRYGLFRDIDFKTLIRAACAFQEYELNDSNIEVITEWFNGQIRFYDMNKYCSRISRTVLRM